MTCCEHKKFSSNVALRLGDNFFRIGLELGKASRFNSHTEKHEEYFCKGKAA